MAINKVLLSGRLTRDPEPRRTDGGKTISSFTIAVNENWKNVQGEERKDVSFVECRAWGKQADSCNDNLKKGSLVLIDGKLKLEQWESKQGEKRQALRVMALTVFFLDHKSNYNQGNNKEDWPF